MILDIVVVVYLIISVLVGLRRGATLQLFNLVGLVVAALLYFPLGRALGPAYGKMVQSNSPANILVAGLFGALLVVLVFLAAGYLVRHFVIKPNEKLRKKDRSGGAAMGAFLGVATVYITACVFDQFPPQAYAEHQWLARGVEGSRTLRLVRPINILPEFRTTLQKLHLFNKALVQHGRAVPELLSRPAVRELVSDPLFQRLLEAARDPRDELHKALKARDYWWLVNDERVLRVLADPVLWRKVQGAMKEIDLAELKRITASAPDPGYGESLPGLP